MDVPVEFQLWDTQQVLRAKGNSLPVLWRDVKNGSFPAPIVRGRGHGRNLWSAADVIAWQQELIRKAKGRPPQTASQPTAA